jgi:hypothetical protein
MSTTIRPPRVTVEQVLQSVQVSPVTPALGTVIYGPCFQIVEAFDSNGTPQSEGYAGTYKDTGATKALDLPGLIDGAEVPSSLEDEIEVWLVMGDVYTQLGADDFAFSDGVVTLDADLIGSTTPTALVYVSYRALRVDLSPAASNPALTRLSDVSEIEGTLGVISTSNPLALAAYFALSASGGRTVSFMSVGAVSDAAPEGTEAAYAAVHSFLEGVSHQYAYRCVPLTQSPVVHAALDAHVTAMSAAEEMHERVGFVNPAMPLYSTAQVIASGTVGSTGEIAVAEPSSPSFSASVDFTAAGAQAGDILVVSTTMTAAESPTQVHGVVGDVYGVRVASIKVDDDYVLVLNTDDMDTDAEGAPASLANWNNLSDATWTLYRSGSSITEVADQAEALASAAEAFGNRRVNRVCPPKVIAPVDGLSTELNGYYAAASLASRLSARKPGKPYSKMVVPGFTDVKYSNGYFKNSELDRIAGGGNLILVRRGEGAPLTVRHQLTTDTSSITTREASITEAIDYGAIIFRETLEPLAGKYNITQSFLDNLAVAAQGVADYLEDNEVFAAVNIIKVDVSESAADTIEIEADVDVFYPGNTFKVRFLI